MSTFVVVSGISHSSIVLMFLGGVDIGDGSEGSGDCELYFSSCRFVVEFATAIVARIINGLGGRFMSFRLGGIFGRCSPNPSGIIGSFESQCFVTYCGAGDAIDDIDIISRVSLLDISVEMRTIGVFGLGKLGSLDD